MTQVPQTYEDWERCITVDCGIPLTRDYVAARIDALQDDKDFHTQKFVKTWGEAHRAKTLGWFRQAATALEP
ncbi:hypothetical protein [uncultured Algimonas sp.]|uniref:hypothetical protein n=1 Tax=uncultured Algimonas sp. TaxID=1547920 RepID=UPI002632E0F5|nr:hypothetical protein [uncultured Algimonas sp.]